METASMSSREVDLAEREARKAREGSGILEAEGKRLSTQVADLNTSPKYDLCSSMKTAGPAALHVISTSASQSLQKPVATGRSTRTSWLSEQLYVCLTL